MIIREDERKCLNCGSSIRGRSDKKFCDDGCRNNYHNQHNSADNNLVRDINHKLMRNRRILQQLLPAHEKKKITNREHLYASGFHFHYMTHTHTNTRGNTYKFCYDHGYLLLDGDRILIVRRKEMEN